MGGQLLFGRTQDAWGTPFDPSDPDAIAAGIVSNTVQKAIIEVYNEAHGSSSRFNLFFGFDGTATTTRWLEQSKAIPSNNSPYIVAENSIIKTLSVSVDAITTATLGLYKNGVLLTSISLSGQKIKTIAGLNFSLIAGDQLSAKPTAGSFSKPAFNIGIQVL